MRLIDCKSWQLVEFNPNNVPPYAILSHTWGNPDNEVLYTDMIHHESSNSRYASQHSQVPRSGLDYSKVRMACEQARKDKLNFVWIDTCCIDKRSSAELSEAINSMFNWYLAADRCYAYLEDVQWDLSADTTSSSDASRPMQKSKHKMIKKSRWFTRGWTLQELLAPKDVHFFDRAWNYLGEKAELQQILNRITLIPCRVLTGQDSIGSQSLACRMSWAAKRQTTRPEDIAYCLLGVFGVNMPLLYGEGGERAYRRLQEEIMKHSSDQSLFAWGLLNEETFYGVDDHLERIREINTDSKVKGVLASHPSDFEGSEEVIGFDVDSETFLMTNNGLRIEASLYSRSDSKEALLILNCGFQDYYDLLIAIPIIRMGSSQIKYGRFSSGATSFPHHFLPMAEQRLIYLHREDQTIEKQERVKFCLVEKYPDTPHITIDHVSPSAAWDRDRHIVNLRQGEYLDKYFRIVLFHWTTSNLHTRAEPGLHMAVLITCSLAPDGKSATLHIRRNLKQSDLLDLIGVGSSSLGRRPSVIEKVTTMTRVQPVPDIVVTTENQNTRNPQGDQLANNQFDKDFFKNKKKGTEVAIDSSTDEASRIYQPAADQIDRQCFKGSEVTDVAIDSSGDETPTKRPPRTKRLDKVQRPIPSIIISDEDRTISAKPSSPKVASSLIAPFQANKDIFSRVIDTLRDGSQLTVELSVQQRLGQKIYVISLRHDPQVNPSSMQDEPATKKSVKYGHRRLPSGWEETKEQYFVDIDRELERRLQSKPGSDDGSLKNLITAVRGKIASSLEG